MPAGVFPPPPGPRRWRVECVSARRAVRREPARFLGSEVLAPIPNSSGTTTASFMARNMALFAGLFPKKPVRTGWTAYKAGVPCVRSTFSLCVFRRAFPASAAWRSCQPPLRTRAVADPPSDRLLRTPVKIIAPAALGENPIEVLATIVYDEAKIDCAEDEQII